MPVKKQHKLTWQHFALELGQSTRIMGVLNVTPDSFSDGGRFFAKDKALAQAEKMIADGADIIDIGGESSRPFSEIVSVEEECRRVLPVIEHLAEQISVPISIDTTKAEVASRAISAGASMINDISSLQFDPEMGNIAAKNDVLLVLMHMKGTPADMQVAPVYDDLVGEIYDFLLQAICRAEKYGVAKSKIIADPGIGFGKTISHNLFLIKNLEDLNDLGVPIMIGPSRKAFIRKILSKPDQPELKPDHPVVEIGTQAAVAAAVMSGAHIVRVHDVASTYQTIKIIDAIIHSTQ